jgi:hypothetical protein
MARVAEARMCVREAKAKAEDQARTWLDEAEEYAQRMEMPRLLADVLITRVEAQLQVGERASAGDLCARALRVTSLYGMRLKKLETLELMCRVNAQRGEREAAKRLRSRVLRAAQDIGFLLLLERAERTQHLFD